MKTRGASQIEMAAERLHLHHEERAMEQQPSTSSAVRPPPVPWFGFEEAFTFVSQKGKNVVVQCNYCLPGIKYVGSAISTASNVKQHLKKAHPEQLRAILEIVGGSGRRRGRPRQLLLSDDGSPAAKMIKKQPVFDPWRGGGEIVTQNLLDTKLMNYVVEETLPLHTVEKPTFRELVGLGLPRNLTIMCAKTLRDRIESRAARVREALASQMAVVPYVATTADCWTSGEKTSLWVTAHWINPVTLKREFGALACKQLEGPPLTYGIHHKVTGITTDNDKHFSPKEAMGGVDVHHGGGEDGREENVEFVCVSEILDTGRAKQKEMSESGESLCLPPHRRCASHTLNLVATQDIQAMISDSSRNSPLGAFRKHFLSLMEKCSQLWSRQNQSVELAAYIHEQCGTYLKVLDQTRWNATFEALKQLNELLATVPGKMDDILDRCSLDRIATAERVLLQEYMEIMGPLARALDILQRENSMFMGYLLPTLYSLDRKLQRLENKPEPYAYCLPVLRGLRSALRKRFDSVWEDKDLLLAACLHPFFKLDWLEKAEHRSKMEAWLKAELQEAVGKDSEEVLEEEQESDSDLYNYFDIEPGRKKSGSFLKYNSGIPSSAAVERLFATDARAMAIKSHSLPGDLLEELFLVKQNGAFSVF
ncbi:hypothetical protein JRQ81_012225 [Phrynocephalus forsythii]|uniref:BED-type domain-containing protein n=1 Tax=Phrynocephalus forsythii TaxID=171643 RepID=A0A9Q1APY4_9SAUR|nr:hypothetical protein JRQ81_012225 [Phrynocephalus forsythii]